MIDSNNYLRYKSVKEGLNVTYRGFDMKWAMSKDILFYCFNLSRHTLTLAFFKRYLLYKTDLNGFLSALSTNKVLFTTSIPGIDHFQLVKNIQQQIDNSMFVDDSAYSRSIISVSNLLVSFRQIFFNKYFANISVKEKLIFVIVLSSFKGLVDDLMNFSGAISVVKYVAAFSGNRESIYVQFFTKRGVPTYCLQHGLHLSYLDYKIRIPADVCCIENFNADYMLGWGEFTKEALLRQGFDDNNFMLAGSPKYSSYSRIKLHNSLFSRCVVNLARDLYHKENFVLLEIAGQLQEMGIHVFIKRHPRSDINLYQETLSKFSLVMLDVGMSINEVIDELVPDFVIVYNSTVYYEYYLNNIVAFRFSQNENDIPFGLEDDFADYDGLMKRIDEFKAMDINLLNREANRVINRFCAIGVNNYVKILN